MGVLRSIESHPEFRSHKRADRKETDEARLPLHVVLIEQIWSEVNELKGSSSLPQEDNPNMVLLGNYLGLLLTVDFCARERQLLKEGLASVPNSVQQVSPKYAQELKRIIDLL